jgi:nucleotide-binding universal stress UspA family protein
MQTMTERILMPVDDTPASERAVDYAALILKESAGLHLHLVHVEPVRPQHLAPDDAEFRRARDRSSELLARLRGRLEAAGVDLDHVDSGFLAVPPDSTLEEAVLDTARDHECTTIAVGRNALPWYKERFHRHPADALAAHPHGHTLWIVGG